MEGLRISTCADGELHALAFQVYGFVNSERYLEIASELEDALCRGRLMLHDVGHSRVELMAALRGALSLGPAEVKELVGGVAPVALAAGSRPALRSLMEALVELGAVVSFEPD